MSRATALAAVRTWIYAELGGVGGISNVIYAEQATADAPRPDLPYVTIEPTADVALSACPHEICEIVPAVGAPGDPAYVAEYYLAKRWQRRRVTVTIAYYGDDPSDAFDSLRMSLRRIVEKSSSAAALRTAGVLAKPAAQISDTTELRSTVFEPSATQDWWVYYVTSDSNSIGIIETVSAPITTA